ncbi:CopG family transcriptional regulator [Ruficoccus amylovorans]|uniref:CopG family transcriptional regulator n=1 Tax=Ruficoccus amylovorans TaxID=1804625 RepID=A0A842HE34_9BACT|nr:DUF6364 family protein [Ruficoccus amylovorans]MBC2593794.1 CopG family transcriptional regulator [Ruficoccus amylovorans]
MKNLTLRIEEPKLNRARKIAAERSTSVNALIRDYLDDLIAREDRQVQARVELLELCQTSKARVGNKNWSRGDLYDR